MLFSSKAANVAVMVANIPYGVVLERPAARIDICFWLIDGHADGGIVVFGYTEDRLLDLVGCRPWRCNRLEYYACRQSHKEGDFQLAVGSKLPTLNDHGPCDLFVD